MVEVIFAATLGVVVAAAIMTFATYSAKLYKSIFAQLKFNHYTRRSLERIAQTVRYAKSIQVQNSGKDLFCTNDKDVTSKIYYLDADGDPDTLVNNRLMMIEDVDAGSAPVVIGRFVSPMPGTPVFAYQDRTSAVEVHYRVGDPREDGGAKFQRETGPGPQGVDVNTAFGPRNSYLD